MAFTVLLSIGLAVALFMMLPFFVSGLFKKITDNTVVLALIEGLIRVGIFIVCPMRSYSLRASMIRSF